MKLGSLFDGSGTCPLAASAVGIIPAWASEVEPYPVAVTRSRFPNMTHLGSVTDIHGGDIEPVDIITFGSPCQDLSVAGKRAGLKHESNGDDETTRSGLFMEAVRIIKEMREATNGEYPTFAIWENVPGAFSSNKGEDFRTVLEELIKIVEPTAVMPAVPKNGWSYADSYCGDGWSLAYRILDAQYWGVPQRRRRIYLVLDLRGQRAREVLFEREGLRRNFAKSGTPGQAAAGDASGGSGANDRAGEGFDGYNGDLTGAVSATLGVNCGVSTGRNGVIERIGGRDKENCLTPWQGTAGDAANRSGTDDCEGECVAYSFDSIASNRMKSKNPYSGCRRVEIAKTLDTTDPNPCKNQGGIAIVQPVPYTLKIRSGCDGGGNGALIQEDKSATLATNNDQYLFQPVNMVLDDQGGHQITVRTDGKAPTLRAETHGNLPCVLEAAGFKAGQSMAGGIGWKEECAATLAAKCSGTEPTVCVKCYDARGNGQTVSTSTGDRENRITDYTSVVCMAHGQANAEILEDKAPCLNCNHEQPIVAGVDCRNSTEYPEQPGTLQADCFKNLNSNGVVRVQYIVRRLTPAECARLQGFPDDWGHPDHKEDFTDEEYRFWLNVRNTHAAINGKPQKDYTKAQMLAWYNKLHTDSSEYKMWGNGMAFPCMLYIMEGVQEVLAERYLKNLFGGDTSDR